MNKTMEMRVTLKDLVKEAEKEAEKEIKNMRGKTEEIDSHKVVLNYIKRKGTTLPPIFENVAICMACGKEKHINTCGFCEKCWVQFSSLRKKV